MAATSHGYPSRTVSLVQVTCLALCCLPARAIEEMLLASCPIGVCTSLSDCMLVSPHTNCPITKGRSFMVGPAPVCCNVLLHF